MLQVVLINPSHEVMACVQVIEREASLVARISGLAAFLALLIALMFLWSVVMPMPFGAPVLFAALSGLALLAGGATFSLLSEKYTDTPAPAAIGYAAMAEYDRQDPLPQLVSALSIVERAFSLFVDNVSLFSL